MPPAAVSLLEILQRADVWRGNRLAALDGQTQSSGFDALDAQLPGAGWPRGALIELLADQRGIGEIALLLPALRAVSEEAPIAVVAPPGVAHAPAWAAQFALERLICVDAPPEQIAWSAEQLLGSGALGALLAWLPAKTSNPCLRRLQLTCEGSRALVFLFRLPVCAGQASPAPLRLGLDGCATGLRVEILKRRGPACDEALTLQVERPLPGSRIAPLIHPPQPLSPPTLKLALRVVRAKRAMAGAPP